MGHRGASDGSIVFVGLVSLSMILKHVFCSRLLPVYPTVPRTPLIYHIEIEIVFDEGS